MIAALNGRILLKRPGEVVIEAGGVGYRVMMPDRVLRSLGPIDSEISIFTYLSVREDALQLYGFESWEEREVFAVLIGVSGIGPKTALGILSQLDLEELVQALVTENISLLTSINGIGKKTAQRLIVELKDRLSLESTTLPQRSSGSNLERGRLQEVIEALTALGYSQLIAARAAQSALKSLGDSAGEQALIKEALKICAKVEVN